MVELLIPLAVFGSLVLISGQFTRLLSNISLNRTLRDALHSHPDSVPLLAERLDARQPWADALIGWIFLAFAGGLVALSLFESADDRRDIIQVAIVPAIVGLVVLFYVRLMKREQAASSAQTGLRLEEMLSPPATADAPATPRGRRSVRKPA